MRNFVYRGFTIDLRPFGNEEVLGRVFGEPAKGSLYSTSCPNRYSSGFRGRKVRTRTSVDSAKIAVEKCQEWIDKRRDLEAGIQQVMDMNDDGRS